MDAFLVFNSQNNLILTKYNKQFLDHLIEFANENGFEIEDHIDVEDYSETLRNLLSVLITPFVASQRYLLDKSEIIFDCIKNSKAVFSKRQEFFFLYIFDDTEKEILMQRKVNIFSEIMQFIFGPAMKSIETNHYLVEIALNMIEKWKNFSESMTFMLESIERLLVGSQLSSVCNHTLQRVLTQIKLKTKSSLNEIPCHTYLFHGFRYITSYSSCSTAKISRRDMLLMLLLSHSINHQIKSENNNESEDETINKKVMGLRSTLEESNYHQFLVFLQYNTDPKLIVPYIYRKVTIEGDLFIIILSELSSQLPICLSLIINTIDTLINEPNEKRCCHTVIQLQNCIKKIKDYAFKNSLINNRTYLSTLNNLNRLIKSKIFEYITDLEQNLLSFQLEAQLSSINNSLRESYKLLIFDVFYRNSFMPSIKTFHLNIFTDVQLYCKKTFSHYLGYFNVKSQRNMTLLGINVDIKDLIGFIYIDRTVNELIIAPIERISYDSDNKEEIPLKDNVFDKLGNNDLTKNIVNMILYAYNSLIDGNLMTVWDDGVLHYSYSLWFENSSGSSLTPRFKNFKLHSYPSIISDNFIQHIINSCFVKDLKSQRICEVSLSQKANISCFPYELFCIYKTLSAENQINVIENTKKLASKLWEIGISSEI